MKITSLYYLQYPDCLPADPAVAASEVYVEVAEKDGSVDEFDYTYSIQVCTTEHLRAAVGADGFVAAQSVIVVGRFEDGVIRKAIESILPRIHEFARFIS